jgi:colanic acid/amylovoran biosynthesis glycosyltransferase
MNNKTFFLLKTLYLVSFFVGIKSCNSNKTKEYCSKILIVTSIFPPRSGTAVLNHITALLDHGHEVFVWSKEKRNIDPTVLVQAFPELDIYDIDNKLFFCDRSNFSGQQIQFLRSLDVILCEFGQYGMEWMRLKKKLNLKAKLITCFRGKDITLLQKYKQGLQSRFFKNTDLFLPVCNYFRDILIQYGCNQNKIRVLHSAIDTKKFEFKKTFGQDQSLNFISVCRLVPKKGLFDALTIFSLILKSYPNFHYYIIGDGPLKEDLSRYTRKLDIDKNVTFLGWKNRDEIVQWLHKCDIFFLPSRTSKKDTEGIPNAAKEAMACGLVTILTNVAGNNELIISGHNGYLISKDNISSILKILQNLIKKRKKIEIMGKNARSTIELEYEKEKLAKDLHEIILTILNL